MTLTSMLAAVLTSSLSLETGPEKPRPLFDSADRIASTSPYVDLASSLRTAADDGPLVYVPNPGNWGDALIDGGFRNFMAVNEIPYRAQPDLFRTHLHRVPEPLLKPKFRKAILVYGGGGAWGPHTPVRGGSSGG